MYAWEESFYIFIRHLFYIVSCPCVIWVEEIFFFFLLENMGNALLLSLYLHLCPVGSPDRFLWGNSHLGQSHCHAPDCHS